MTETASHPLQDLDEDAALRMILEGTSTETGEPFFRSLVANLQKALGTHGAMVTEYLQEQRRLRARAFIMDGEWIEGYEFPLAGTPCEAAINSRSLVHFPDRLLDLFPGDSDARRSNFVSYIGMPLLDLDGKILGHMAAVDRRPMPEEPRVLAIFRIFAARAAAELQRLRAEAEARQREKKLGSLVDSAMDAIIELDRELAVTRINPAAEKVLGRNASEVVGRRFSTYLAGESCARIRGLIGELDARPEGQQFSWIAGGLEVIGAVGEAFPAEATLSRFEVDRKPFYTLILRNVNERLEAERRIHSLTAEAEYLREEVDNLQNFGEIVGRSQPVLRVLADINQVAQTDATVLIFGETGTGKELIARAIHAAGPRREKPLIKVNCAAIPRSLMESEFFGHEKGAFTGATEKREGRFALADGGTIFLDEVGELPLELQVKLLRVLQEGEFEPVGSSQTKRVDVRVLAATNRDLARMAEAGEFREDLYYRLNVFPLTLPPLRERGDDIVLLANQFVEKFSRKMGRTVEPLTARCIQRLKAYHWPGNVRELQNVIERALITSRDGRLNLERALPEAAGAESPEAAAVEPESNGERVRTVGELQELERRNLMLALEKSGWKISGEEGAAQMLGMKPSTLSSRMKALDIQRP